MLEVYDRERIAALLKEAQEITAGLKSEMGEIATQMSRVLDGREGDTDHAEGATPDPEEWGRPRPADQPTASQDLSAGKPFWQFWR
jgi:hypothetical protein